MASRKAVTDEVQQEAQQADWHLIFRQSIIRSVSLVVAVGLASFSFFLALALLTYDRGDPAVHTAAGKPVANWMGSSGAWAAEQMLFFGGVGSVLIVPLCSLIAWRLWCDRAQPRWKTQWALLLAGILALGVSAQLWAGKSLFLPAGWGGVFALLLSPSLTWLFDLAGQPIAAIMRFSAIVLLCLLGLWLCWRSLLLPTGWFASLWPGVLDMRDAHGAHGAHGEHDSSATQSTAHTPRDSRLDERAAPEISESIGYARVSLPKAANPELPPIDLLEAPSQRLAPPVDKAALEDSAHLLESVLDDFQVKGSIIAVRPGPVVTMYELEPASGTKASRVANLADDIARNMSALSARIAPIRGSTVIGIELPNARREAVMLREMIASAQFQEQTGMLPIILGKDISGGPMIVDLAPIPHLLIAGTTGSGKSVGLNAMILSLLYRMTPDQCRLIMIDSKMLELSVYDGIPHLLSSVVTEPYKAIRALKWAVEQMEERYRVMSSLSVRNISSYNSKVKAALAENKSLDRCIQTGYDPETGLPIYEEEKMEHAPVPQIVIIVGELTDLMMVAGKEVEFLIQRLAQKARAAGIHLILATQRPSVDVITGVIKANLPTRISFQVTSKIDSRTILGEVGAEQLLGKGDMLYVAGGRRITRIHSPFVSDDEVRTVADHWRAQGQPGYVKSVIIEPDDNGFALSGAPSLEKDSAEERLYAKACQLVIDNQKASTSWLQRQLRIGYNSAARLIERMEAESLVSSPNHVGRREILSDQSGQND